MRFKLLRSLFDNRAAKNFNARQFQSCIEQLLAQHNLPTARQVGGIFKLDTAALTDIRNSFPDLPAFAEATCIVVEKGPKAAAAYIVGRMADGAGGIASLQNYARPQAINSVTDPLQARRNAHIMRLALIAKGQLLQEQRQALFSPAPLRRQA